MARLAGISITDGSVVFALALLASRGELAITRNMILAKSIETHATGLEDLFRSRNISHRGAVASVAEEQLVDE